MKNKIPDFLLQKFKMKGSAQTRFFNDDIKQFMINYDKFYNWNLKGDLTKIFKIMKSGITDLPQCEYQDCKNKVYFNWELKLTKGCCYEHSLKISNLTTYGVESNMHLDHIKDKIKKTNIERYGCEHASQSEIVKDRMKATNIEKYGCEYASSSSIIKKKVKETVFKRFGVENIFSSEHIKNKSKRTCLNKYGTEYAMQHPDIIEKSTKNSYRYKEYTWKTGEVVLLQGHEPIILNELENDGYSYGEVLTDTKDMPEIWYEYDGTRHRYIPDFYIPAENLIIEAKSEYTMQLHQEKNKKKFKAVKDYGFNFKLEIR